MGKINILQTTKMFSLVWTQTQVKSKTRKNCFIKEKSLYPISNESVGNENNDETVIMDEENWNNLKYYFKGVCEL